METPSTDYYFDLIKNNSSDYYGRYNLKKMMD